MLSRGELVVARSVIEQLALERGSELEIGSSMTVERELSLLVPFPVQLCRH